MRYKVVVILFALTSVCLCSGQEKLILNGTYWNGMPVMQRLGFIQGYSHGYDQGLTDGKWIAIGVLDHKLAGPNTPTAIEAESPTSPDGITVGQLVEGVDLCYKDFRNTQLPISACVQWAVMGVKGRSDAERETVLQSGRKFAAEHPQ
jgi:hypothetical protein